VKKMSLVQQCHKLSLYFYEITLPYKGKPEPALLKHFESQGYLGTCDEGYPFLTILKALMLDKLSEFNIFSDRDDACCRYLEAQLNILKDKTDELIASISDTNRDLFIRNMEEILNQPLLKRLHPGSGLSLEFAIALFDAVETKTFKDVAYKIAKDTSYRSGWPDLIIIKDKEVQFIEVKTTDKLHNSQLLTIPAMQEVLPYKFSVYRIHRYSHLKI
jgi:hypothetical protein